MLHMNDLLILSSSELHFFFVLEEFALHALDSRVSLLQPLRNEVKKVLPGDIVEAVWCPVPVIDCIVIKKFL